MLTIIFTSSLFSLAGDSQRWCTLCLKIFYNTRHKYNCFQMLLDFPLSSTAKTSDKGQRLLTQTAASFLCCLAVCEPIQCLFKVSIFSLQGSPVSLLCTLPSSQAQISLHSPVFHVDEGGSGREDRGKLASLRSHIHTHA